MSAGEMKAKSKAEAAIARIGMAFHVADYLAQVDPKTLGTMTVYALTKLQAADIASYNCLAAQLVRNTLNESGFSEALDRLKQKLAAGDTDGAAEVAEWLDGLVVGLDCLASGIAIEAPVEAQQSTVRKIGGKGFVM